MAQETIDCPPAVPALTPAEWSALVQQLTWASETAQGRINTILLGLDGEALRSCQVPGGPAMSGWGSLRAAERRDDWAPLAPHKRGGRDFADGRAAGAAGQVPPRGASRAWLMGWLAAQAAERPRGLEDWKELLVD